MRQWGVCPPSPTLRSPVTALPLPTQRSSTGPSLSSKATAARVIPHEFIDRLSTDIMSERLCPCGTVASGFAKYLRYRPGRFIYVAESNSYRYPGEGGVMRNRLIEGGCKNDCVNGIGI